MNGMTVGSRFVRTRGRAAPWLRAALAAVALAAPGLAGAQQDGGAASEQELSGISAMASGPESFWGALSETVPILEARTRVEYSDQAFEVPGVVNIEPGIAYTGRARFGFLTGEYRGFQAKVVYDVSEQFGPKRFNAAGIEGDMTKSGIGDPESARFGEAYLSYALPWAEFRVGRQRLSLGNGILIGPNEFRNNGNNFDALTVKLEPLENLELFYGYVYNVQRLFGSRGKDMDFDSRSNLLQATYRVNDLLQLKAYGFLLDVQQQGTDANSTDTYGLIASGNYTLFSTPVGPLQLSYYAEGATQTDAADSTRDYRASYAKGEVGVASPLGVRLGLTRQVFGTDDGIGFASTIDPQLVRDVFLLTPANGLVDSYATLGLQLPFGLGAEVQYHEYESRSDHDDYGKEIQVAAVLPINSRLTLLSRVSSYRNADPGPATNMFPFFPSDTLRYSLQIDFKL